MIEPSYDAFVPLYEAGTACLVRTKLIADLETPVSAFLKLSAGRQGLVFLLESVEGGAARGRYSMIGLDPDVLWRAQADRAEINRYARRDREAFEPCPEGPLESLRALVAESRIEAGEELPPMAAGVFGYLGYDMVRQMETLAPAKPDPIGVPDAFMMRPTLMLVFDTVKDEMTLVTPVRPADGISAQSAYDAAVERIDAVVSTLEGPLDHDDFGSNRSKIMNVIDSNNLERDAGGKPLRTFPHPALAHESSTADPYLSTTPPRSNTDESRFREMVERAKHYIRAGDIFQVVLSQRFTTPFALPAFALYRALRRVNPAPFLCYLDFGSFQIVCSSPEILVRVRDGKVTIRPIAGTRWRGKTLAEDLALEAELLADEKECAEHLMLLDLGRNDVGRVAAIGSVEVTDRFSIERYSHVMHIVSNVEGRLDTRFDAIDALCAGFPRRHGFGRAENPRDGDHR